MLDNLRIPKISFTEEVFRQIRATVGSAPAETGGVLGGDPVNGTVTEFFFDAESQCSATAYSVVASRINPVINAWNQRDIHLCGFVHSHPRGMTQPSSPDIEFAQRLLNRKDNSDLPLFLVPIVQSSADGQFSMRVFAVARGLEDAVMELPYEICSGSDESPFPVTDPTYRETFDRVQHSYDLHRLHHSMVIAVGCGGSASFLEDLARTGIRYFILIDPDTVQMSNLATQHCYRGDVGRPKVETIKARILEINPLAEVTAIPQQIESLSDAEFDDLVFRAGCGGQDVTARLLCGMTDSFWAQMRVHLLGLHFGLPLLSAQVYRGGRGCEIVFTHPETTRPCARCILSSRYRAYIQEGFQNDAGSEGAQYFATVRLNATKFFVAMAILHHGTTHPFWGGMLERIGQRNCIQIRCDPDLSSTLGLKNFDEAFAGASAGQLFCDETIWRPQHPENRANGYSYDCPDCAGTGNLRDSIGRFADTRAIVIDAKTRPSRLLPLPRYAPFLPWD